METTLPENDLTYVRKARGKHWNSTEFIELLTIMEKQLKAGKLELILYQDMMQEIVKFMGNFGFTLGLANADLKQKSEIVAENRDLMIKLGKIKKDSEEAKCLNSFILWEKKNNFHLFDGKRNKDVIGDYF